MDAGRGLLSAADADLSRCSRDFRAAAERAGVPAAETPGGTSRGRETFFDGKVFDPENPAAYLASLSIKKLAGA